MLSLVFALSSGSVKGPNRNSLTHPSRFSLQLPGVHRTARAHAPVFPDSFRGRSSVPLLHAQEGDGQSDVSGERQNGQTRNENDEMGVDFSWDGGTIALVLGALLAIQFFVLANI